MFYWQLDPARLAAAHRPGRRSPCTCRCRPRTRSSARSATTRDSGCTVQGGGTQDLTDRDRPDRRAHAGHHRDRPRHGDTPDPGNSVPWTGRWDRVLSQPPARCSPSCCSSPRSAPRVFGSVLGAKSREKRAGLPGPLRAAGRHRPGAGEVHLRARPSTATTYVATLMYAAEKGAVDLTRDRRHLDDHRQGRARRAGPGWTRSPPTSRTCSAAPARRSPPARRTSRAGQRLKTEIGPLRARASRPGRTHLGQPGQQRARRARRPAGAGRLRRDARRRDLEPVLA